MQERKEARKFIDRTVVTKSGKKLGMVGELTFDPRTGELMAIVLKSPTSYIDHLEVDQNRNGHWLLPFSSVIADGDFIVVAEEDIV